MSEPASPMKTRAGWKLWRRKPRQAPARAAASSAAPPRLSESARIANVDGRDRADAGGEAVHAVDEVEAVHQRDDPEHRHGVLQRAEIERMQQRQREVVDRRPGASTGMAAAASSPASLTIGVDLEAVVEQADRRAHAGAEQDRVRAPAERRLQQQHGHRDRGEHRDAAAERDRARVQAPARACGGRRDRCARDARRERRQPEREHARPGRTRRARRGGPGSRARLARHERARRCRPGPYARTRTTSVPAPRRLQRQRCTPLLGRARVRGLGDDARRCAAPSR